VFAKGGDSPRAHLSCPLIQTRCHPEARSARDLLLPFWCAACVELRYASAFGCHPARPGSALAKAAKRSLRSRKDLPLASRCHPEALSARDLLLPLGAILPALSALAKGAKRSLRSRKDLPLASRCHPEALLARDPASPKHLSERRGASASNDAVTNVLHPRRFSYN